MPACDGRWRALLVLAGLFATVGVGAQTPPATAAKKELRGLVYAREDGLELKLDLHLPVQARGPLPVVLWLHAGGWREGGRGFCPIANLAKEGYAVASVSYRLSQQAVFPAQIKDCKAAVRWLRAHAAEYQLDATRIGACGESAGGQLAALLGVSGDDPELEGDVGGNRAFSSRISAVVALCPPVDLTSLLDDARERSFWKKLFTSGDFNAAKYAFARGHSLEQLFGGPLPEHAAMVRRASPLGQVTADDAAFLLIHGRNDPLIPLRQSEAFAQALRAAGVEERLVIVETDVHGFGRFSPEIMAETRAFFGRHLRVGGEGHVTQ